MKFKILITLLLTSLSWTLHGKERIPGTKISINPPAGFVTATQFPGYVMESAGSSIMVTPIPGGPFPEVSKGFTSSGLASQGMKLLEIQKTKIGSADGVLIHASQSAHEIEFLKWTLVFGNNTETTIVAATFPKQLEEQLSNILKESILSTEWQEAMNLDFMEGVDFRVSESGSLKFASKIGNTLILTENGIFPQKEPGAPTVIVGASISQGWKIPTEPKEFSIQRLQQTKTLGSIKMIEGRNIEIDGLDGYIVFAEGVDHESREEIYIEQCLLFTNDGHYIFQALIGKKQKADYTTNFQKILHSFKRI